MTSVGVTTMGMEITSDALPRPTGEVRSPPPVGENPIGRIEQLALSLHPQVTAHQQINGSYVLRRADIGRYATVPSSEWGTLSRLDGKRKVGDLMQERLQQGKGFGLLGLVRRIMDLQAKGFLIPESERVLSDRKFGLLTLGLRLPLPNKVSRVETIWPWIGALTLSALSAILLVITETIPTTNISDGMFLAIWGSVVLTLSLRSILSTIALAQAGTRPWRIGVAWAWWVPFLFVDTRDVQVSGRMARIVLALSEFLSAPLIMAIVLGGYRSRLLPPDIFIGAMAGALITLWWILRPFGNGPLMELTRVLTGKELIWQDARAYLSSRLWKRAFERGDLFPSEGIFIALALVYPIWGYCGLVLFGQALGKGLIPALSTVLNHGGESSIGAFILLGTFFIGVAIAVGGAMIGGLWWMMRVWRSRRPVKLTSPPPTELDAITQTLAEVPFFAPLPQETLGIIAADSKLMRLSPHSFAVNQDTIGDQFFIIKKGKMAVLRQYESGREEQVAALSSGDTFGEMALLMNSPRTASVKALTSVDLISITRSAFEKAVVASGMKREDVTVWLRLSQQLRHSPLFAEMSANEVAYFLKRSQRLPVGPGDVLIQEGDVGNFFYIILSGKFEVHRKGEKIGTLTTGDFVGEIALLAPTPRTATVTAVTHSQVLELSRHAFFETLSLNLAFSSKIIETAQERRNRVGGVLL